MLSWINDFAKEVECSCGGRHNPMICPTEHCWNCGEPGHWNVICPNKEAIILSKEDFDKEIASYEAARQAENVDAVYPGSDRASGSGSDFDDNFDD
jgi:hypothetical protein